MLVLEDEVVQGVHFEVVFHVQDQQRIVIREDIKIGDDLSRGKGPDFVGLATDFVEGKNGDVLLVFAHKVELIFFLRVSEFLYLLTMRKLFELFFTQHFVEKPHIIINNKCDRSQTDKLMHGMNLVIVIGVLELFAIVLIIFLEIFHIINPNLILLVDTQPAVHH